MINFTSGTPEKGKPSSCTPPVVNGDPSRAVPVGDPGQGACITRRCSGRYHIEIEPFVTGRNREHLGCHWAVVGSSGFNWSGGCRSSVFEAAAAAFLSARSLSRGKSFKVVVLV